MIYYIERQGARIVRVGSVPCARSVPQPRNGEALEIVAAPPNLPAFWRDGAAHPVPPQPSTAHKFNYDTLGWEPWRGHKYVPNATPASQLQTGYVYARTISVSPCPPSGWNTGRRCET